MESVATGCVLSVVTLSCIAALSAFFAWLAWLLWGAVIPYFFPAATQQVQHPNFLMFWGLLVLVGFFTGGIRAARSKE